MSIVTYLTRKQRCDIMSVWEINIKRNHNILAIKRRLKPPVITVSVYSGKQGLATTAITGIFVLRDVIPHTAARLCHPMSSLLGKAVLVIPKPTEGGRRKTLSEWHFLRQGDMREKKVLRVVTLLRSGKNSNKLIILSVSYAASARSLLKTILFHCQKAARILLQTFNHCAEIVTVKSGSIEQGYFNIYENPELLEMKQ